MGLRSEIEGPRPSTTVYEWVTVELLPAASVAVTLKLFWPSVEVSSGWPSGTSPVQEARPEPPCSSEQE